MAPRWPVLDHPAPLAFAHRGGAPEAGENTLAAFGRAVELGFRYLETDVHLTSDGVVVAFHDDRLDRVTDRSGLIAELTWADVARARVDGREPVPRLVDLLDAFPDARLNIDAKSDEVVGPLTGVISRARAEDRVCLASFSDRRLRRLGRLLGDRVCRSLGPAGLAALRLASYGIPSPVPGVGAAQLPATWRGRTLVDDRLVTTAHDRGLQVHVWTVDDPDEMERLLDLGVDGIMTDRAGTLRTVMESRGAWPG